MPSLINMPSGSGEEDENVKSLRQRDLKRQEKMYRTGKSLILLIRVVTFCNLIDVREENDFFMKKSLYLNITLKQLTKQCFYLRHLQK